MSIKAKQHTATGHTRIGRISPNVLSRIGASGSLAGQQQAGRAIHTSIKHIAIFQYSLCGCVCPMVWGGPGQGVMDGTLTRKSDTKSTCAQVCGQSHYDTCWVCVAQQNNSHTGTVMIIEARSSDLCHMVRRMWPCTHTHITLYGTAT